MHRPRGWRCFSLENVFLNFKILYHKLKIKMPGSYDEEHERAKDKWYEYLENERDEVRPIKNITPTFAELKEEFDCLKTLKDRIPLWSFLSRHGSRLWRNDLKLKDDLLKIIQKELELKRISHEEQLAMIQLHYLLLL